VTRAKRGAVLHPIIHVLEIRAPEGADAQLLEAFVSRHDEAAFAALVRRHGGLVLHVSRRVLGNAQDAEDAFQAAFLLLARRAASIHKRQSVSSWLYQVAYRLARRAKAQNARRQAREEQAVRMNPKVVGPEAAGRELQELLDVELSRLPAKYRTPLVLCYLQGKTHEEAAHELGWPLGTVRGRVARARELLHERLTRRGLTLSAAAFGTWLAATVARAAPARLVDPTIKAALAYAAGAKAQAGLVTAEALALAEGGLTTMGTTSLKIGLLLLLGVGLAFGGAAGFGKRSPAGAPAVLAAPAQAKPGPERVEKPGEPLPPGATAHLGSRRFWVGTGFFGGLTFSADGKLLAALRDRSEVLVWSTATGKEVARLAVAKPATNTINLLAFAPDGKTLAVVHPEAVRLWDVSTGKEVRLLETGGGEIRGCVFAPDGKTLAAPGSDGRIYRWEVATGKKAPGWDAQEGLHALAFAPDGKTVATAGPDQWVRLYQAETGKTLRTCAGHRDTVLAVAFAPGGKVLASAGADGTLRLWEADSGKQVRAWDAPPPASGGFSHGHLLPLRFSADRKTLAAGRHVFEAATGLQVRVLAAPENERIPLVASADGKYLAAVAENRVRLLDAATGKELRRGAGHQGPVLVAAFSPDGKTLATGGTDRTILLWDLATGKELRRLEGHRAWVNLLGFSPDGKYLASACTFAFGGFGGVGLLETSGRDPTVSWWEVATGKEVRQFRCGPGGVRTMGLSPDGKELTVIEQGNGGLSRWDTTTGKQVRQSVPPAYVNALSPDGKALACGGVPGAGVQIQDLTEPAKPRKLEGELRGGVSRIIFAPDGRTLVTAGPGLSLQLWDVVGGRSLRLLRPPENTRDPRVVTPVFSPDGKVLAVPGGGGSVSLVEVATDLERRVLKGDPMPVSCVAFSPDGAAVAAGSQDGTALVWAVPRSRAPKGKLTEKELEARWQALAGHDAAAAYEAIQTLAAVGDQAVPLLKKWLPAAAPAGPEPSIDKLIADLSNKDLKARKQAEVALEKRWEKDGLAVKAPLVKALEAKPSVDVKLRLEKLIAGLGNRPLSAEEVRTLRAVEAVEAMPAKQARQLLQAWAKGAPGVLLTEEARAALARLSRRGH
jgi:RNA polymerase sigma factor (sigma-70 family)